MALYSDIREIFEYRTILWSLVKKNLFGQYKSSHLGFYWHFITPLVMLALYYVVFTEIRMKAIDSFWLFLSAGIFPFHFLMGNLTSGTTIITGNAGIIKKIYFPREILVLSRAICTFIIMIIGLAIVIMLDVIFGNGLSWPLLSLIPVVIMTFFFAVGYMLIFSAITVYVRDLQHFFSTIHIIFFVSTPVYYIASEASGLLGKLIWFNPFTYFVTVYQDILYWNVFPSLLGLLSCFVLAIVSMFLGIVIFAKLKHGFTERV